MNVNFLNVFEQRIGSLFGATSQGLTAPFSFKKLAKKAAREMESETFVIDGVDTAPALFTILVSSEDDLAMRPLYEQLTHETAQFIEGQAQNKGYVFVGRPVVRFMADPSLKSGRFSVFAENVDVQTLNRLREEEAKFMGAEGQGQGGAASQQQFMPIPSQVQVPSGPVRVSNVASDDREAGLDVLPQESVFDAEEVVRDQAERRYDAPVAQPQAAAYAQPAPQVAQQPESAAQPAQEHRHLFRRRRQETPAPEAYGQQAYEQTVQPAAPAMGARPSRHGRAAMTAIPETMPAAAAAAPAAPVAASVAAGVAGAAAGAAAGYAAEASPAPEPVVRGAHAAHAVPAQEPATTRAPRPVPAPPAAPVTCLLIDRQSGRTYTASAPRTVIGRERTPGGVVLHDPNVSRSHAELSFNGAEWVIRDLNSTNGTLVNDVDVDECALRDGDVITLGLVTLEFRER